MKIIILLYIQLVQKAFKDNQNNNSQIFKMETLKKQKAMLWEIIVQIKIILLILKILLRLTKQHYKV